MGQAQSCSNLWTLLAPMILDSAPIVRNIQSVKIDRLNDKISKLDVSKVQLISFVGGISATVCLLTSFIGWIVSIIL